MRPEEERVAAALCGEFGMTSRPGEDPPDIYLSGDTRGEIAVEITTMAQYVLTGKGAQPRRSSDEPALRLANGLDNELRDKIPDGAHFTLFLEAPILNLRKTARELSRMLCEMLGEATSMGLARLERDVTIEGNNIGILLYSDGRRLAKKIAGVIQTQGVDPDVLENLKTMLQRSISTKTVLCANVKRPVWLALMSDYFFTDLDDVKYAYGHLHLEHPFERILLVERRDGTVGTIFSGVP